MALSWVLPGELTSATQEVRSQIEGGAKTVVPLHWRLEIANALCVAERRQRISQADTTAALAVLQKLSLETDSETGAKAGGDTLALARQNLLSVYEAAYLELAMRQSAALASLDGSLRAAAKKLKVRLLPESLER
jgi:predicted nucleic acid-binding protein